MVRTQVFGAGIFAAALALTQGAAWGQTVAARAAPVADTRPLIAYTHRTAPMNFTLIKPLDTAVANLGAAAESRKVVSEFGLQDPAADMGASLTYFLAGPGGAVAMAPIQVDAAGQDIFAGNVERARYILDVIPGEITAGHYKTDWFRYGVTYSLDVTLFDADSRKAVSTAHCLIKPKKSAQSPTYRELTAYGGDKLKAIIQFDADVCRERMKSAISLRPAAKAPAKGAVPAKAGGLFGWRGRARP